MAEAQVYLNGRIIPAAQAAVGVCDAGLLHGAGAFTTMRAHNGRVFRLERHLERLFGTVAALHLRTDAAPRQLAAATADLLAAAALPEARLRITLTPGGVHGGEPTTLITAEPLGELPRHWYERGLAVALSPYRQPVGDPTCGHKTGCYLPRMLAMQDAAGRGAAESLWLTPGGHLAEACFCNAFLVLGGRVLTPPLDTPVLPGIVREAVLELCRSLAIPCRDEEPLDVRQMLAAEEMFLTSAISGVRPVVRLERRAVGDEKPGAVTLKIMDAYGELLDRECPAPGAAPS